MWEESADAGHPQMWMLDIHVEFSLDAQCNTEIYVGQEGGNETYFCFNHVTVSTATKMSLSSSPKWDTLKYK